MNRKWTFAFLGAVAAPRHNIKREEASLPLDVRRSKTPYSQGSHSLEKSLNFLLL